MASFGRKSKVAKPGAVSTKTTEEKKAAECAEGTNFFGERYAHRCKTLLPSIRTLRSGLACCVVDSHPNMLPQPLKPLFLTPPASRKALDPSADLRGLESLSHRNILNPAARLVLRIEARLTKPNGPQKTAPKKALVMFHQSNPSKAPQTNTKTRLLLSGAPGPRVLKGAAGRRRGAGALCRRAPRN